MTVVRAVHPLARVFETARHELERGIAATRLFGRARSACSLVSSAHIAAMLGKCAGRPSCEHSLTVFAASLIETSVVLAIGRLPARRKLKTLLV